MDFDAALNDLHSRQPEAMPAPSLERIAAIARLLDDPQLRYPSIHVTGTNGKTTTARIVTALSCAHGLTAGTFVSPHVVSVTERLSVCGEAISEEGFAEEYGRLLPFLESVDASVGRATYFEALTALAYLWFADKPVGLGVFEVGMGGTWDATNLVTGDVAVLCPVGLDHMEQLGSTVGEIAAEKAGIVKAGAAAVVREQRPEAMEAIERRAQDVAATVLLEGRDYDLTERARAIGGQLVTIAGIHGVHGDVFLPLFGQESGRNAAAAVVAVESLLGRGLDDRAVRAGLAKVTSPGRVEVVGRSPLVILDGAHNPDAARALADTLGEFAWERLHLVVGIFADKDVPAVLQPLLPMASVVHACRSTSPRAAPPELIAAAARELGAEDISEHRTVASAVAAAMEAADSRDLILVTGSFYTVADARPLFLGG